MNPWPASKPRPSAGFFCFLYPSCGTGPPACDLPHLCLWAAPRCTQGPSHHKLPEIPVCTPPPSAGSMSHTDRTPDAPLAPTSPIDRITDQPGTSATARDHFLGEGDLLSLSLPDALPSSLLGQFGAGDFAPPPPVPPLSPFELFATDMAPAVRGAAPPTRRSPPAPSADLIGSAGRLVRESALRVPCRPQRSQHDFATMFQLECVRYAFAITARSGGKCTVEAR